MAEMQTITINGVTYTAKDANARPGAWLPTLAEIGAAPAGFGLGEFDVDNPITKEELNYPAGNGWRFISASYDEWSDVLPTTIWGVVRIDGLGVGNCRETIYDFYWGLTLTRICGLGTWNPWEYINPPMELGTEYRTTERWNGKAVYTKLINCGALANNAVISPDLNGGFIVRGVAYMENRGPLPFDFGIGSIYNCWAAIDNVIYLYSGGGYDGKTIYAQLWYVR